MSKTPDQVWTDAVEATGIWVSPCAEQIAAFGRELIPSLRDAFAAARAEGEAKGRREAIEAINLMAARYGGIVGQGLRSCAQELCVLAEPPAAEEKPT